MESPSSLTVVRAPFSFHCTICYEAFNLTDRAPVVLPCGHTYLCEPCSKRLDRCMECRTPLTVKVEKAVQGATASVSYSPYGHATLLQRRDTRRSSYRNTSSSSYPPSVPRQVTFEPVLLPIPRNHVLMCLIDAVQKSSEKGVTNEGYESGDDDEPVLRGMKFLGSSSGTYVVRERQGLLVYPKPPKDGKDVPEGANVRTLKFGQTVQIFLFENKIATVARGEGYILVDDVSQLVKVGEVTDGACKLQAASQIIDAEIQGLKRKIGRLRKASESVKEDLKNLMENKDDTSVFGPVLEDAPMVTSMNLGQGDATSNERLPQAITGEAAELVLKCPHSIMETQSYDEQAASALPSVPAVEASRSFDNPARYGREPPKEERQPGNTMNSYLVDYSYAAGKPSDDNGARGVGSRSPISPYTSTSSGALDFASGFSGHRGLNRTKNRSRRQRSVMMMSHY